VVKNDDHRLDRVEYEQHRTRRRREKKRDRKGIYALVFVGLIVAIVAAAPTIAGRAGIARNLLRSELAKAGWEGDCESIEFGWTTPASVKQFKATGPSGDTKLQIDHIDVDKTLLSALREGLSGDLGTVRVRGCALAMTVTRGSSSLEEDIDYWMKQPSGDKTPSSSVKVEASELAAKITDATTQSSWTMQGGAARVKVEGANVSGKIEGVLADPDGVGGGIITKFEMVGDDATNTAADLIAPEPAPQWSGELETQSLPVSLVSLVRTRFPDYESSIPARVRGDITGSIKAQGGDQWLVSARDLQLREFKATFEPGKTWSNHQAKVNGDWIIRKDRIIADKVRASADFASIVIDADFMSDLTLAGADTNPVRWLESIRGVGDAEIDLAALETALPGLIPVREDVKLQAGKIIARVETAGQESAKHQSRLQISTDTIRGRANNRDVVIEPATLTATVSAVQGGARLRADNFEFRSSFGGAQGSGELTDGNARFDIDFGRLAAVLQSMFDLGTHPPTGSASGQVNWSAESADRWRLTGEAQTDRLSVLGNLPAIKAKFSAIGSVQNQTLSRLDAVKINVEGKDIRLDAELIDAIDRPSTDKPMPIKFALVTDASIAKDLMGPSFPTSITSLDGTINASGVCEVSSVGAVLGNSNLQWRDASLVGDFGAFAQSIIETKFEGQLSLPDATGRIDLLTVASEAFSLAAAGTRTGATTDLEMNMRAKLERLQTAAGQRIAENVSQNLNENNNVRAAAFDGNRVPVNLAASGAAASAWVFKGDVEGDMTIKKAADEPWKITNKMQGKSFSVLQPPASVPQPAMVGGTSQWQTVWAEPDFAFNTVVFWDDIKQTVTADSINIQTDWMKTELAGDMLYKDSIIDVKMQGNSQYKMRDVAQRLSSLASLKIDAEGDVEKPVSLRWVRGADGQSKFDIDTAIGWDRAATAGLVLGKADVPIHMNETSVTVDKTSIPVGTQGKLNVAGEVHYRPGPLWMQVTPGPIVEGIELTPEITRQWMQYLAPVSVKAANVAGTIGIELDDAVVMLDAPALSKVRGRLNIQNVTMDAGPMTDRLLQGVDMIRSLAGALTGQTKKEVGRTLVTMPPQRVEFQLDSGIVTHDRMFFTIDRAQIMTSGRVSTDGQLDLVANMPIDERWVGSDLGKLAGRPISIPIRGNFAKPDVDTSAVGSMFTETAVEAGKQEVDQFLEKQLNRGFEKLFGK
jgi:translocation and assembly module TamB